MEPKYENAVIYTCVPEGRGGQLDYLLSTQWHECWDYAASIGLRGGPIIQEFGAHSGEPLEKRRGAVGVLRHFTLHPRYKKLLISRYECLSSSPSELIAILAALEKIGVEVIVVHEPFIQIEPYTVFWTENRTNINQLETERAYGKHQF